jgi:hypothetical protein
MGLNPRVRRFRGGLLVVGAGLVTSFAVVERPSAGSGAPLEVAAPMAEAASIVVDYPLASRRPPGSPSRAARS